jgi:broad specificity phosphatase PhoE
LGKFYYRPPGGESWTDVALRCRSLLDSLEREHGDRSVLLVTHEVVIIVIRYILERLDEHQALELSTAGAIANCSLTVYEGAGSDQPRLHAVDWTAPVSNREVPVTEAPDIRAGSR